MNTKHDANGPQLVVFCFAKVLGDFTNIHQGYFLFIGITIPIGQVTQHKKIWINIKGALYYCELQSNLRALLVYFIPHA